MKRLSILGLLVLLLTSCGSSIKPSERLNFNKDWVFFRVEAQIDSLSVINGKFPAKAENVEIPHTARIEPMVVNDQWQGICYYKKEFLLSKKDRERELFVTFDAAMNVADVWVNGTHLCTHLGGYLPFSVRINDVANFDGENVIVVRLDNNDNPITGPKPLEILDFNTYGGIYRDVWFESKAPIYSSNVHFQTSNVTAQSADLQITIELKQNGAIDKSVEVEYILSEKRSKNIVIREHIEKQADDKVTLKTKLESPMLWSPKNPNLYILTTNIFADGDLYDSQTTQVGIRDIAIEPNGLFLNGEKTFLRGVNRHQEYPYIGYALSDEAQYRDAYMIKNAGFDYVRGSHYPQSPAFMKACDELGIFVLDAILGWQYFGDSLFMAHALKSSRELIRRDRNHPCVLAWELSINETWMPEEFPSLANKIRDEEAPNTYTAGWMKGRYDIYIEARQHRHGVDTSVPLIVSEYGDWEYYAQNAGLNQDSWGDLKDEERTSRQPRESSERRLLQQAANIQEAHNDNFTTNAFADGYWVMFDYNRGYADDLEYSGIADILRLPKFAYYFFQSQRSINPDCDFAKPMVHIASHWEPMASKNVRVFSNCDEVALYLDGKLIARQKPDSGYATDKLAHPPFTFNVDCKQKGELKAEAYYNSKLVASHKIRSAEEPVGIELWVGENGVSPVNDDVIMIHANVIDNNGTTVFESDMPILFEVEGGIIVNSNQTPTLGGIATIVVKTSSDAEELVVTAKNPDLKSTELTIPL